MHTANQTKLSEDQSATAREDAPTLEQAATYQATFDYFNKTLFDNTLPPVILNFSRGTRGKGFFAPFRWAKAKHEDDKAALHEISLSPRFLHRSLDEIFSTLVHEMVHHWQQCFGRPSRSGYHNKEWAKKMISIGLMPDNGVGGITGRCTHRVIPKGKFAQAFLDMPEVYKLPRRVFSEGKPQPTATGMPLSLSGKRVKYSCPTCGINLWGRGGLEIICAPCHERFSSIE